MGKKLRLELETLAVESFDTGIGGDRIGTVRGHDDTEQFGCTAYCGSAEGSCAAASCAYSQCVAGDTCGCGISNVGSCPWQLTCQAGQCGPGNSPWMTQYCASQATCNGCDPYSAGDGGCNSQMC